MDLEVSLLNFDVRKRENYFGLRFNGYIKAQKDGIYKFYL